MKKIAFLFIFASALLFACDRHEAGHSHGEGDSTATMADGHEHADGHDHGDEGSHDDHSEAGRTHTHDAEGLHLDNGQKWKINAEMLPHVTGAETVFSNYVSEAGNDYKTLAAKLKEHSDNLIKSCTMQGESHDQLHVWLIPHIDLVTDLSEVDTEENAGKIIEKLKSSFATFDQHFE